MDLYKNYTFNDQWFYDLAENLGNRNLNYSLLDQVIFGCHMYQDLQIQYILDTFPQCKIIRIVPADHQGQELIHALSNLKLNTTKVNSNRNFVPSNSINDSRVLSIPFGSLFNEKLYYKWYDHIINFLNLNGRLICFDYVKYYLSKQHNSVQSMLVEYSKTL
jgi:hypothetical protein